MSSSAAMPATGEPSTTRGTSPHASVVPRPTASRRRQISGTSSTRIQCSWMFWRSVRSAVSRPNSVEMPRDHAELLGRELPAVDAHAEHEVLVLELVRLEGGGPAAVDARLALRVEAPPAEAAVQVGRVDRREAALGVDRTRCARARARPPSSCFHSSLALSGSVPSTFHCPCGREAGRAGRSARAAAGARRSGRSVRAGSGGRGIRRRGAGHGLLLPQRAHSARSWCPVEARRVRGMPTGCVSCPVTPCRIASHSVVVRHRGLRRRTTR